MADYDSPSSRINIFHGSKVRPHQKDLAFALQHRPIDGPFRRTSYFDVHPENKMSSPTASLVADWSQNFHLGASPAVPTPRRSLMAQFSSREEDNNQMMDEAPLTPYDDIQSSPNELMEVSPLPIHGRRMMVRSISMFEPEQRSIGISTFPDDSSKLPSRPRPALGNRKACYSFASPNVHVSATTEKENYNLATQFEDSPRKFTSSSRLGSVQGTDTVERSPLQSMSTNTFVNRRLPQFRRTQSMVTKNDDFLAAELALQPIDRPELSSPSTQDSVTIESQWLPSFSSKADQMRRIDGSTLTKVLDGAFKHMYDKLVIIDCRFEHEYEGGHIPNAINVSSLEALNRHPLLTDPEACRTLIILHCEYSAHRAPRIALHLRNRDRMMNAHRYPRLLYPELYILDGGYSMFYQKHRHHVGGMGYVEMNDPTHKPCASRQMHDFRKNTKFQRTQSYTFGQSPACSGGESMQREDNFKLTQAPKINATALLNIHIPLHHATIVDSAVNATSEDDSCGDSSMIDVDDINMTSPVPRYASTMTNEFQKLHTRSNSGRIDPRRLSSF